jgi:hypothetical protein
MEPRTETARKPRRAPWLAAIAAWLVPGAGHILLGKWARGLIFLLLVGACLWFGVELKGHLHAELGPPLKTLGTLASAGLGLPYAWLRWFAAYSGSSTAASYEYGTAFLVTAGLMNLLLILDAWDIAAGLKE